MLPWVVIRRENHEKLKIIVDWHRFFQGTISGSSIDQQRETGHQSDQVCINVLKMYQRHMYAFSVYVLIIELSSWFAVNK